MTKSANFLSKESVRGWVTIILSIVVYIMTYVSFKAETQTELKHLNASLNKNESKIEQISEDLDSLKLIHIEDMKNMEKNILAEINQVNINVSELTVGMKDLKEQFKDH